jgi:hypothetical protein
MRHCVRVALSNTRELQNQQLRPMAASHSVDQSSVNPNTSGWQALRTALTGEVLLVGGWRTPGADYYRL